jgi:hypothetical protein
MDSGTKARMFASQDCDGSKPAYSLALHVSFKYRIPLTKGLILAICSILRKQSAGSFSRNRR